MQTPTHTYRTPTSPPKIGKTYSEKQKQSPPVHNDKIKRRLFESLEDTTEIVKKIQKN